MINLHLLVAYQFRCSKKFLIEHLPADQVSSPQKAHELAVRFENHVAMSTVTKVSGNASFIY